MMFWFSLMPLALARELRVIVPPSRDRSSPLSIGLSTRGGTAFRVRFDTAVEPIASPMVQPDEEDAAWTSAVSERYGQGIESPIGSLHVSERGQLTLLSPGGDVLTWSDPLIAPGEVALVGRGGRIYGAGAGPARAEHLVRYGNVTPVVNNQIGGGSEALTPHYYCMDGYAALGVVEGASDGPALAATFHASGRGVFWRNTRPGPFELYLLPSATLELGTMAYYGLVGRPRVPPLWTFGFIASRWGWADRQYIEDTLSRFRSGGFPADAFIVDFEWYTGETDYSYGPEGKDTCVDFGYSNETFPDPARQLAKYRQELHFRMGGIRKPRLCNSQNLALARTNRYLLPQGTPGGDPTNPNTKFYAIERNLDFSNPDARHWYAKQHEHYLDDGVEFWWNDEGEADYFQYEWWNVAQDEAHKARRQGQRRWSLNRAFSPGMARFGLGLWTGDSGASWEVLAKQPGYALNWALAGAPHVASDVGGFVGITTAELLVRWYQMSVFLPIMRVHSTRSKTPHFPWLWGDEAGEAMKAALEFRYRLIPYHYSFAHAMFEGRRLWMRPMLVAFPDDRHLSPLTQQWMDGDILVAPVVDERSLRKVRLPTGTWHKFEAGSAASPPIIGPVGLDGEAPQAEIPAYVRVGTIVTLAPVVQYTDALPGGALEVRVYGGADAELDFVEDDGWTMAYETGSKRRTLFKWSDDARRLSWSCEGRPPATVYKTLFVVLYGADGVRLVSEEVAFDSLGSVALGGRRLLLV